ncbi:MAG: efflux transporter outer membrane subunit [Halofilum sp. (in: g-proteobacteria)]
MPAARSARRSLTLVGAVLLITGCAVGPDYERPDLSLPADWEDPDMLPAEQREDWSSWWERYEDPALEALVERATAENLEIQTQAARVRQARAQLGLAEAEQLPRLDLQAEATRQEQSEVADTVGGGEPFTQYGIAGVLDYELDLWGRLDRGEEAARARLLESAYAADAVRLSVISDVVTTYFELRAAERQLQIAQRTAESRERNLGIQRSRYEAGATTELTYRQAQAELESVRAEVPGLRHQVERLENALGVLVGQNPRELMADESLPGTPLDEIRLPAERPDLLPSELLERRPDVRAAEALMIAANADIGGAKAQWFPSLNLSAMVGTQALDAGDLFSPAAGNWSAGASLLTPLLDFGRIRANVETAEAVRDQAELQYRTTVRTAFREVRDALTLLETANERLQARQRQVAALQRTLVVAERRYEGGYTSFIEVLDAQRALLDAELAVSTAVRDRFAATATLYRALGGGWSAPPSAASDA